MVKRKKISSAAEELENGMTVGQQAGSGVDGSNKPIRKLEGCEEDESAERTQSEQQPGTKRDTSGGAGAAAGADEAPSPCASGSSPNPSGAQPNPAALGSPPAAHDQHHFLRSSVRPPSKRIRKDGPAVNGHSGTKTKVFVFLSDLSSLSSPSVRSLTCVSPPCPPEFPPGPPVSSLLPMQDVFTPDKAKTPLKFFKDFKLKAYI